MFPRPYLIYRFTSTASPRVADKLAEISIPPHIVRRKSPSSTKLDVRGIPDPGYLIDAPKAIFVGFSEEDKNRSRLSSPVEDAEARRIRFASLTARRRAERLAREDVINKRVEEIVSKRGRNSRPSFSNGRRKLQEGAPGFRTSDSEEHTGGSSVLAEINLTSKNSGHFRGSKRHPPTSSTPITTPLEHSVKPPSTNARKNDSRTDLTWDNIEENDDWFFEPSSPEYTDPDVPFDLSDGISWLPITSDRTGHINPPKNADGMWIRETFGGDYSRFTSASVKHNANALTDLEANKHAELVFAKCRHITIDNRKKGLAAIASSLNNAGHQG